MENVFRDYGRFENESNNQIICFNVTRTYLLCEIVNISMLTLTTIIILLFHLVYILGANLGLFVAMPEC